VSVSYSDMIVFANLLQQVINLEIHLEDSFLSALVMQSDDECSWGRGCDIEVYIWAPKEVSEDSHQQ